MPDRHENGAEMPCELLISLQLPLLCSIGIVEVRTRGPKRRKNEERDDCQVSKLSFLCSFCENFSANLPNADLASYNLIVPSFGDSRWWATPGGAGGGTLFVHKSVVRVK